VPCCWLLHVFTDIWQYFDFRYYNYTPVGLYIDHNDTWPMFSASYWLIINRNGTLLPFPVHWNVCNQWDVSNTNQVATVRRTCCLHPVLQHVIQLDGSNKNRRRLSDKLVAYIQCSIFSTNNMWAKGIGMQLPGHLVADTMCSDMLLSNQTLVTRISGRWTNHHVLMLEGHCFSGECTLPNLFCVMNFSVNMFETNTANLYRDYLVMWNVLHYRCKSYY
jgi:hypothetical protein